MEQVDVPVRFRSEDAASAEVPARVPEIRPDQCPGCSAQKTDALRCEHCGAALRAGGYVVLRAISQGPHGRVYEALGPSGQRVALKELSFSLVPDAATLDAFHREAELLRSFAHSQIPRLLDAFSEGAGVQTRLYLVQEFVEGESLQDAISKQPLTPVEARRLARQVLRVLDVLHGRDPPVLHRDIKPANLILRPDGAVSLVDFGAARILSRGVTHGATLVGTFGYMPPEQMGGTVDASSDLYALGATLLHALTGKRPEDITRDGLQLDVDQHLRGVHDPGLRRAIKKLVAPSRADRFRTAAEALEALRPGWGLLFPRRTLALAAALAATLAFAGWSLWANAQPSAPELLPGQVWPPEWEQQHPPLEPRPAEAQMKLPPGSSSPDGRRWSAYMAHVPAEGVRFPPDSGGIAIITRPPGARVVLDGVLLEGETPFAVAYPLRVAPGYHVVKLVHEEVVGVEEVEVVPGLVAVLRGHLYYPDPPAEVPRPSGVSPPPVTVLPQAIPPAPSAGKLVLQTQRVGLKVFVDGFDTGRTTPIPTQHPLDLKPGRHSVQLLKDGKLSSPQPVVVTRGEVTVLQDWVLE